jgi:hypothetical protein
MTTREHIRRIFLEPKPTYALGEAQHLLGYSKNELLTAISAGDLATVAEAEAIPRVPWEEIALCVLENASQAIVEEALGEDSERGIPELVRLPRKALRLLFARGQQRPLRPRSRSGQAVVRHWPSMNGCIPIDITSSSSCANKHPPIMLNRLRQSARCAPS